MTAASASTTAVDGDPATVTTAPAAGPRRDAATDLLKGVAIVGVMVHHVANRRFPPAALARLAVLPAVFCWAVGAFLLLSGYLQGRSRRAERVVPLLANRARRLLLPYLCIGLLYAGLAQAAVSAHLLDADPAKPHTLLGKAATVFRLDPAYGEQLYFFPLLFAVSAVWAVVATGLFRAAAGPWVTAAAGVAVVAAAVARHGALRWTGLNADMLAVGLFEFGLGFCLARSARPGVWPAVAAGVVGAGIALAVGLSDWRAAVPAVPLALFLFARRLPAAAAAFAGVRWTGRASGTIFAYHTPFLLQTGLVLGTRAHMPVFALVPLALAATLAACLALDHVLCRVPALRPFRI